MTIAPPQTGTLAECHVLLDGPLDEARLRSAIQNQVRRHEILDSQVQTALSEIGPGRHALTLSLPARLDARSLGNLVRGIGETYANGRPDEEDTLQWADVLIWRQEVLTSPDTRMGRDYWSKYARGMEIPAWNSALRSIAGNCTGRCAAYPPFVSRLQAFAASERVSLETVFLAAWTALLSRITGQQDLVLDVESDGRPFAEFQRAVGPFAQILPFQARVEQDQSFRALLARLAGDLAELRSWQEAFPGFDPIAELPAFDYQELPEDRVYGSVTFHVVRQDSGYATAALRLSVRHLHDQIQWEFQGGAADWSQCLRTLLETAVESPDTPVARLPLLDAAQRHKMLVEWNQTAADYPRERCIHELIELQAARTPDREAVRCGDTTLTYRELNGRANQLAHQLRKLGITADQRVGLCLERRVELIVGLLGILKAGGAYVPLHGEHPRARLAQQLDGARVLLTEAGLVDRMPEFNGPVLCLDRDRELWASEPAENPALQTTPENLVYVLFTSGSTGVPKGVAVRHRNVVNYTWFARRLLDLEKYSEGLQFGMVSTICADVGITCIFPSLVTGGCLHVIAQEVATDSERMGAYASRHGLDVLKIVPSHLAALLEGAGGKRVLPSKYLVVGGEKLKRELIEQVEAAGVGCQMVNHYAPTETTCGSLTLKVAEFEWRTWGAGRAIPLGRPIANTRLYVLDGEREPVPVGVMGELYISGDGVSAGYVGDPHRTADRFLLDPFHADATMYRSGDLVRYLGDGKVEFLDRVDDQVKIRGYRVELGEVEAVLKQHAGVKQAVVLAREDPRGDKRVVAYLVARPGHDLSVADLRNWVGGTLPNYMVPAAFVMLPSLPLNANGKVNRAELPDPESVTPPRVDVQGPRNRDEEIVWKAWCEVLETEAIGVHDNFFDLGGHSLLAVRVLHALREATGKEISPAALFQGGTVEDLAKLLSEGAALPDEVLTVVQPAGSRAPFFAAVEPGASATGYILLSRHLGPEQPFYKLQTIGEKMRWRPYTLEEYNDLADRYIRAMKSVQPEGPYHIAGMCEGAFIAFYMAQKLEAAGDCVGLVGIFDTWPRENTSYKSIRWLAVMRKKVRRKLRKLFSGTPEFQTTALPPAPGVASQLRRFATEEEWNRTYWPGKDFVEPKIRSRISVFRLHRQHWYCIRDRALAWGRRTQEGVDVYLVEGDHLRMLREPAVTDLASKLTEALQTAKSSPPLLSTVRSVAPAS